KKEISLYSDYKDEIETIYIGGGTPSLLSASEVGEILERVFCNFNVARGAEITLEANPNSLDGRFAKELRKAGINRLSIGVQSLSDDELTLLGRLHNASEAEQAMACVMEHFENFSVDIIYAIPGQSSETLKKTLRIVKEHEVPHISAYELTLEEHTELARMAQKGLLKPLTEDEKVSLYWTVVEELGDYLHYEISNYALKGFQCRHNRGYWLRKNYLGFGPSAHGLIDRRRYENHRALKDYLEAIKAGKRPVNKTISLTENQIREERVFLGLRTSDGVRLDEYEFNKSTLSMLNQEGLIVKENGRIRLTERGMLLSNRVISELLFS
ncbi:MAG: radical SAM family heme chaperone HemW, partial [Nitrospirae bacterium]